MKKRGTWIALLLFLLCAGCLAGCGKTAGQREAEKSLGLELPTASWAAVQEDRGWFGDGETLTVLRFEGRKAVQAEKVLSTASGWRALPLDQKVERLLYGGETEAGLQEGVLTDEAPEIPHCGAGYWYYRDRTPEGGEGDCVSNFTAAVYDTELGALYLLRWDS